MYAHQAIDDYYKVLKIFKMMDIFNTDDNLKYIKNLIQSIKEASKFSLGDSLQLRKSVNINQDDDLDDLIIQYKKYLKLPFKLCWFDFSFSEAPLWIIEPKRYIVTKYGSLVYNNKIKKRIEIAPVFCIRNSDSLFKVNWQPLMVMGFINLQDNKSYFAPPDNFAMGEYFAPNQESLGSIAWDAIYDVILVLLLLNCKNIEYIKNKAPAKLNKKRIKNKKQPLFSHYTLSVKQDQKYYKSIKNHINKGENRVHFCRGHIKKFTKNRRLFGKHTGVYWWDPQVRGNRKKGIIVKDYKIDLKDPEKDKD